MVVTMSKLKVLNSSYDLAVKVIMRRQRGDFNLFSSFFSFGQNYNESTSLGYYHIRLIEK